MMRIRPAKQEDTGFILSSWFDSFRSASALCATLKRHSFETDAGRVYWMFMKDLVRRWAAEPDARTMVACDPEAEDTLVGFAAASGQQLHYVYIRDGFRRSGHARALVESMGPLVRYSMQTEQGERRLKPRERGWIFTPRFTL